MKSTDIKIGEKYKIGYYGCGEVLETRVPRSSWRSTKTRKDGVKVLIETGHHEGQEIIVGSRDITQTWSEYTIQKEAQDRAQRVDRKDRERTAEKLDRIVTLLSELGVETSNAYAGWTRREADEYYGDIELSESAMGKMIELLENKTKLPAENTTPANPLAELLG